MAKEAIETKPDIPRRAEIVPWRMQDVERIFDGWLDDFWSRPFQNIWRPGLRLARPLSVQAPALDVYEQKDDFIVKAEIPGMAKDEIDISLEGNTLTIKGEKKKEEEVKEQDYYRCERTFGSFLRTIELPVAVQTDKVSASFKNGVLEVRLPKTAEAKKNVVNVKVA
jgi:HSP20 family protein